MARREPGGRQVHYSGWQWQARGVLLRDLSEVAAALRAAAGPLGLPQHHPLLQACLLLAPPAPGQAAPGAATCAAAPDQERSLEAPGLASSLPAAGSSGDPSERAWAPAHGGGARRQQDPADRALAAVELLLAALQQPLGNGGSSPDQAALAAWAAARLAQAPAPLLQEEAGGGEGRQPGWQQEHQERQRRELQRLSQGVQDAILRLMGALCAQDESQGQGQAGSAGGCALSLPACATLLHALALAGGQAGGLEAAVQLAAQHLEGLQGQAAAAAAARPGQGAPSSTEQEQQAYQRASGTIALLAALAALPVPRPTQRQLFEAAGLALLPLVPGMSPAQRAELLHAFARARLPSSQLTAAVVATWREAPGEGAEGAEPSPPAAASAAQTAAQPLACGLPAEDGAWLAWRIPANLPTAPGPPGPAEGGGLEQQLRSLSAAQLSRLAWAATTSKAGWPALYDALAECAWLLLGGHGRQHHMPPPLGGADSSAGGSAGGSSSWGGGPDASRNHSSGSASASGSRFASGQLPDLLWALAMARHEARPLCRRAARHLARRAGELTAGQLSLALWALARLGCPDQVFTEVALQRVVDAARAQRALLQAAWASSRAARQGWAPRRPPLACLPPVPPVVGTPCPCLVQAAACTPPTCWPLAPACRWAPPVDEDPYAPPEERGADADADAADAEGGPTRGRAANPFLEDGGGGGGGGGLGAGEPGSAGGGAQRQALLPGWQAVYCLSGLALARHYDEDALEALVGLLPALPPSSHPHVAWALAALNFQGPTASRALSWLAYRCAAGRRRDAQAAGAVRAAPGRGPRPG